jgi:ribonuclease T1
MDVFGVGGFIEHHKAAALTIAVGTVLVVGAIACVAATDGLCLPALAATTGAAATTAAVVEPEVAPAVEDTTSAVESTSESVCLAPETLSRIQQTLADIENGVQRYTQDGSIFRNAEGRLPEQPIGYYKEYTVPDPAYVTRGVQRIVTGANGEVYFTADHYLTFIKIRP